MLTFLVRFKQACIMKSKDKNMTVVYILIITIIDLCCIQAIHITVVDNENEKGVDNSSCLMGKIHCLTLDFVFTYLSDCHSNPTSLLILNGNYTFTLNSIVTSGLFRNCPTINITGVSVDNTSIVCGVDAGFAFQNILQVKIANINLTKCGSLRNSTSVNVTAKNSSNTTFLLSTALYFTYCKNVQIVNVTVQNSNSTGVVMYNTYGKLLVEGSSFNGNSNQKNSLLSNGGFYIEFVYCDPGKVDEHCIQCKNSYANYHFKSNNFLFNHALNKIGGTLFYLPYKTNYYSFGRGGGLSIVFKGNASNNIVIIDDCMFFGNTAAWGGGLLVEFEDYSKNNTMIVNNTHFSNNLVIADAENGYGTAGGGVRVGFVIFDQNSVQFNSIQFENCSFNRNRGLWGGGFAMYAPSEPNAINATNLLSFKNCSWTANKGLLGSAVDLDYWRIYTTGSKMQVKFLACKFHDNKQSENDKLTISTVWREFNSFGTGALYANGIPIIFEETVEFINNTGSALAIYDTTASFTDKCTTSFTNNSGWMGGAIALLGASQMWINPHTVFLFQNNTAGSRGGAIYALQTSRHDLLSGGNCFLRYSNRSVSSPDKWMTEFIFGNNYAPIGSSIFATTLLSCAWGATLGDLNFNLLKVLNWTHFSYHPSNNNTIATEISKINIDIATQAEIIPGKYSELPITTVDDKGNNIRRSLWLVSKNANVQVSWKITASSTINLQGMPNSEASIQIVTDSSRVISADLPVKLIECPPGYYLDIKTKTCQCSYLNNRQRLDGILSCNVKTFTAKIKRGYWTGYHLSTEYPAPVDINLVTGQCPRHYCKQKVSLPGKNNITLLTELFCSSVNRNGTLCGRCSNDHSVAINSVDLDCISCSHWLSQYGWITYAITEYVPSTLLFCLVLFFNINLHSGTISSIILFFQIFDLLNIYSDGDIDPPSHSDQVHKGINFVYNIWNLEFVGFLLPPYCLNEHFNTMDILLIKYISGLYPFLLFILFIALTNLVYVRFCGLEKIARYIKNSCTRCKFEIARKRSTVSGLATFFTLAFTKLAVISGLILSRENLTGSENSGLIVKVAWLDGSMPWCGKKHLPYVIPAVFVLVFFVIVPALGLLCYPLVPQIMGWIQKRSGVNFNQFRLYKYTSSALQKPFIYLKPLIDSFQGSCRARCEFYAGLLFWYRISIVFTFSFTIRTDIFFYNTAISLVFIIVTAIFQPYKRHRDNIVTILCISNIVFINVLSICTLYYSDTQSNRNLQPLLWFQLIMVLLPLVFFVVFMMLRTWQKLKAYWKKEPLYVAVPRNDNELCFPVRALEDSMQSYEQIIIDDSSHCAPPQIQSPSGSIQNHEDVSHDITGELQSSINPDSCGHEYDTSDNQLTH